MLWFHCCRNTGGKKTPKASVVARRGLSSSRLPTEDPSNSVGALWADLKSTCQLLCVGGTACCWQQQFYTWIRIKVSVVLAAQWNGGRSPASHVERVGTAALQSGSKRFVPDSVFPVPVKLHISSKHHGLFEVSKGPCELPKIHDLGLVFMNSFDLKPMISILSGMIVCS